MAEKNRRPIGGILSIAIGTILGVLSLALSSYDQLWDFFGVARDLRTAQTTALAILFLSAGFLVAVYFQQGDFKAELLAAQRSELAKLINSIPNTAIYTYYTGDDAMEALVAVLATVRCASNTRVLSRQLNLTLHAEASPWDQAIQNCVQSGLTFREVVSPGNEALVRNRRRSATGGKGVYEATILRHSLPSFLNFIVLEYRDGSKEVWFGWIVSRSSGFEGTVIRTAEVRIVTLFERWHSELFMAGQVVS
jgi:hypothetical protein